MSITRHSNRPAGGKNQREKKLMNLVRKRVARRLARDTERRVVDMLVAPTAPKRLSILAVGSLSADGSRVTLTQRLRELERQDNVIIPDQHV